VGEPTRWTLDGPTIGNDVVVVFGSMGCWSTDSANKGTPYST
jgi:hypothetical protein